MRDHLAAALRDVVAARSDVLVLTADVGNAVLAPVRETFPDRVLDVGIAEQNLIGVAAGLALEGYRPIVYGLAAFLTRAVEQIRLDVCLPGLPVTIIGDGAGLMYSYLGPAHHARDDLASLRALPGLTIYTPGTVSSLADAVRAIGSGAGPTYIRCGKLDGAGTGLPVSGGEGVIVFILGGLNVYGGHLAGAQEYRVQRLRPWEPRILDRLGQGDCRLLVTVEEHSIIGGLGSAVAEYLAELDVPIPRLLRIGLRDEFTHEVGTREWQLKNAGLDPASIWRRVMEALDAV